MMTPFLTLVTGSSHELKRAAFILKPRRKGSQRRSGDFGRPIYSPANT